MQTPPKELARSFSASKIQSVHAWGVNVRWIARTWCNGCDGHREQCLGKEAPPADVLPQWYFVTTSQSGDIEKSRLPSCSTRQRNLLQLKPSSFASCRAHPQLKTQCVTLGTTFANTWTLLTHSQHCTKNKHMVEKVCEMQIFRFFQYSTNPQQAHSSGSTHRWDGAGRELSLVRCHAPHLAPSTHLCAYLV